MDNFNLAWWGVERLELEADSEGRFTLSSLDSLIGVPTSGLKYMSQNSRYLGENGKLMRPYDDWQSEGRVYVVLAKANQQVLADPQTKLVEDENVKPAAGVTGLCVPPDYASGRTRRPRIRSPPLG